MPIMTRQPVKGTVTQSLSAAAFLRTLPAFMDGSRGSPISGPSRLSDPGLRAVLLCDRLRQEHGGAPVWLRFGARSALLVLHRTDVRAVVDGFKAPFAVPAQPARSHTGADPAPKASGKTSHLVDTVLSVAARSPRLLHVAQQRVAELLKHAHAIGPQQWRLLHHELAWNVILGGEAAAHVVVRDRTGAVSTPTTYARQGQLVHSQLLRCGSQDPGMLARDGAVAAAVARQLAMAVTRLCDRAAKNSFRTLQLLSIRPPVCIGPGYLAASLCEASRLWPTEPAFFRQTVRDTVWGGQSVPERSRILVMNLFGHRDRRRLSFADDFAPSVWLPGGHAISDPLFNGFGHRRQHDPSEEFGVRCGAGLLSTVMDMAALRPVRNIHDDAGRLRHTAPPELPIALS